MEANRIFGKIRIRFMTEENNGHSIITEGGLCLIFDDEKKAVTILTPRRNQIVLDDDARTITLHDHIGNLVQLTPDGILLESAKNIVFNAKGKIAFSAIGDIVIAAQADLNLNTLNVANEAKVGFSAKGSAFAELPASVVGDSSVCVGPLDAVVKGSATGMIGGRPVARVGDTSAHGGSIVLVDFTVIIGGLKSESLNCCSGTRSHVFTPAHHFARVATSSSVAKSPTLRVNLIWSPSIFPV